MIEHRTAPRDLEILFYDDSIAVCVKPVGADSQADMPAFLRTMLGGEPYCVHRLDRAVGGVMVYARDRAAAAALGRAIAGGAFQKEYLAVCAGCPEAPVGEMRDLLYHDASKNKTYVVKRVRKGVREAVLDYRVLDRLPDCALVAVRLHTGRSHQIRVQLASRGMPLLGDAKYGSAVRTCPLALWAHTLAFPHPVSGEPLRFSAPPPNTEPWIRYEMRGVPDA